MFVNTIRHKTRPTPVNLAAARVLLGTYMIWKLFSLNLGDVTAWPAFLFETHPHHVFLPPGDLTVWIRIEQVVAALSLAAFVLGFWIGASAFLSALLVAHLVSVHYVIANTNEFLPALYVLLLWAVFRKDDVLSFDGFRRLRRRSGDGLTAALTDPAPRHPMTILSLSLVTLAFTYFFTGYPKLTDVGLSWAKPESLTAIVHAEALMHFDALPAAAARMIAQPFLVGLAGLGTLALEIGFLPWALLGLPIWPFALGLSGMHLSIALTMGIVFLDQYVLFATFAAFDRCPLFAKSGPALYVRITASDAVVARALLVARWLDTRGALCIVPANETPARLRLTVDGHEHVGSRAWEVVLARVAPLLPMRDRLARRLPS